VRVALAEDQALLRAGMQRLFEDAGHEVVAAVADGAALTAAVEAAPPDLVVADIRMPPTHTDEGLEAARWIRQHHPDVPVLLLSQHVVTTGALELFAQRGFGYLLKDRVLDVDEFLDAAGRVAAGGSALDPEVVARLVEARDPLRNRLAALTSREHEVLALMAEGLTNAGIATRLVLADRTVESHTRAVFMKLGLQGDNDGHRRVLAVLSFLGGMVRD
jgi:DNA-binding NarL/FixJ family response regulator